MSRTDPTANRILDEAYDAMLAFGVRRVSVEEVARRAMAIAAEICVYTNNELTLECLDDA